MLRTIDFVIAIFDIRDPKSQPGKNALNEAQGPHVLYSIRGLMFSLSSCGLNSII